MSTVSPRGVGGYDGLKNSAALFCMLDATTHAKMSKSARTNRIGRTANITRQAEDQTELPCNLFDRLAADDDDVFLTGDPTAARMMCSAHEVRCEAR